MLRKLSVVTQLKRDKVEVQTQQPVSVAPALGLDFPQLSPGPREIDPQCKDPFYHGVL